MPPSWTSAWEPAEPLKNLLLIPTPFELSILRPLLGNCFPAEEWSIELCGFGPIAAAARTSGLIARRQPGRVLLVGIAGAYGSQLQVGTAATFSHVACHGIGAGTGDQHRSAADLGWPHWRAGNAGPSIGDVIPLAAPGRSTDHSADHLVTCCAAAASRHDVDARTAAYPRATAEDMEGFGVALACTLNDVPLQIVRGISNTAGDRNRDRWRVSDALHAAAELAATVATQE